MAGFFDNDQRKNLLWTRVRQAPARGEPDPMKLRTAAILLSVFTIGFLLMLWRGSRHTPQKTRLEIAADSVAHYHEKARIAHDSSDYYDARYQQSKAAHDSLAARLFRRDPGLAAERDSLRAVVERSVQDSLRVRAARQRAALPKTQTPPS